MVMEMFMAEFYEEQGPGSDPVTLNCQTIKTGPSMACFL